MNVFGLILSCLWVLSGPVRAQDDLRQQDAESQFDSIMMQNAVKGGLMAPPAAMPRGGEVANLPANLVPAVGDVEVPLERFEAVRAHIADAKAESDLSYSTLVVLGASSWSGRSTPGGLELHLTLQATLRGPGFWKAVPLVGQEVAVVRAQVAGVPIALTHQNGYQVWVTDQVGEVELELDLLVPARGPRGSMEYDFLVARTPVTRFDCRFPEAGLEPRLQRMVRSDVTSEANGTRLSAWLEPTSRIHLVGFRDLGEQEGLAAKVYVETTSLVSIGESVADVFAVLKYSILQAGNQQFDVVIPPGFAVVSAEGAGGFRYTLDVDSTGTILRGETAFPIRDAYEISLRLSRTVEGGVLDLVPPRAVGVEREHGWIGVEVLGTVQLGVAEVTEALSVDVAQLPEELIGSAVSPVLDGWRYHSTGARVRLTATRLPEREPAAGSVDEMVATTTVAAEGRARTELKITLRNRLRHSLRLRLPQGVEVRASELDGVPVTPSREEDGTILLPLKRSSGDRPEPFTLSLSLEGDVSAFGLVGFPKLELPAVELPVSSLRWSVIVPAANRYTRLYGEIAAQGSVADDGAETDGQTTLRYSRYWVGADKPVGVWFGYLRGWLRAPLGLLLIGLLAFGGSRFVRRRWPVAADWAGLRASWDGARHPSAEPPPGSWRTLPLAKKFVLLVVSGVVGSVLLMLALNVVSILANPL